MSNDKDPIAQVIHETAQAYPGGARALAQAMGLQPGTFSNKCNPYMHSHVLNIDEARAMMRASGDTRLLDTLAKEFSHVCVAIGDYSETSDMELLDAWADWDVERSETVAAIRDALSDGVIDQRDLEKIHQEMFEDFKKELALLERLKGLQR